MIVVCKWFIVCLTFVRPGLGAVEVNSPLKETVKTGTLTNKNIYSVKNILMKAKAVNPSSSKNTKYLDDFLRVHANPYFSFDSKSRFRMDVNPKFELKPPIWRAPTASFGEPWPYPQSYTHDPKKLYSLNVAEFNIRVLNRTCDILQAAIRRYSDIIKQYSLPEHYESYDNYNPSAVADSLQRKRALRQQATELRALTVFVSSTEQEYPTIKSDESYQLSVANGSATLKSNEVWGALRGLETFSQLVFRGSDGRHFVKQTQISDFPRFPHRGVLLDTARHYVHKPVIKQVLEAMSQNKMNVLHWHMVDDHSFPYQSEVLPRLSEKGAYHPSLVYSIADVRELIQFARYRGIRIIPEFDSPGHMFSWGLGYPNLKAKCYSGGFVSDGPLGPMDPSKNATYSFMRSLFGELYQVFNDTFFHLGGDELHSDCWATNENIVNLLEKLGKIPSEMAKKDPRLYVNQAIGYYFKRLVRELLDEARAQKRGASFILWEDVLKNTDEIPKDAIIQVWQSGNVKVKAVNQLGYKALFSSCWYLDHPKFGVDWTDFYKCEPSPYLTAAEEKGRLLGGESCLWAENIVSEALMTTMWPRTCAIAERLWSARSLTDVNKAGPRMQEQRCRMLYRGLPVGHAGGPDYCLPHPSTTDGDGNFAYRLRQDNSTSVYLPISPISATLLLWVNVLITMLGIISILVASRCFRRRLKEIYNSL